MKKGSEGEMGLFTGKVMAVALTGSLVLGGVTFAGGEILDKVKGQLNNFQTTQVQYEANEEALKQQLKNLLRKQMKRLPRQIKLLKIEKKRFSN